MCAFLTASYPLPPTARAAFEVHQPAKVAIVPVVEDPPRP
jgi:hypothetical protein